MDRMNPEVDRYLSKTKKWQEESKKLRNILLDCQLTEELKWGKPCYTFQKSNIVIIQAFKEHCSLLSPSAGPRQRYLVYLGWYRLLFHWGLRRP